MGCARLSPTEGCWCRGEYGRVRVSGHLYNNSDDVERFLGVLGELV